VTLLSVNLHTDATMIIHQTALMLLPQDVTPRSAPVCRLRVLLLDQSLCLASEWHAVDQPSCLNLKVTLCRSVLVSGAWKQHSIHQVSCSTARSTPLTITPNTIMLSASHLSNIKAAPVGGSLMDKPSSTILFHIFSTIPYLFLLANAALALLTTTAYQKHRYLAF
jgi:hypothetical protein